MSWSRFKQGVREGFIGESGDGCAMHGRRYPGCPLDIIDNTIRANGWSQSRELILSELSGELQQRGYGPPQTQPVARPVENATVSEATVTECREVIAGLMAQGARDRQALAECNRAIAERDRIIIKQNEKLMHAQARGDRFMASGKRLLAQHRELEAMLKIPGVFSAVRKAALAETHPDRGANSVAHRATLTLTFQERNTTLDRISTRLGDKEAVNRKE